MEVEENLRVVLPTMPDIPRAASAPRRSLNSINTRRAVEPVHCDWMLTTSPHRLNSLRRCASRSYTHTHNMIEVGVLL
jgi:hypothetical protein